MGKRVERTLQYFLDRSFITTTNCWEFETLDADGYGRCGITDYSSHGRAHIEAWCMVNGPVPEGLELDHTCRNRACCNPEHLEAVTHQVNMARGHFAIVTHCPAGHPYAGDNLYLDTDLTRRCRKCLAAQKRDYRRRRGRR